MKSTNHAQKRSVAILISPGFTETEVVYCLSEMRAAGLATALVGISGRLVHSQHGLIVQPDKELSDLARAPAFQMIIIPGSYECVTNLLTSPDFHAQIEKSMASGGHIGVFASAQSALQQVAPFATPTEQIAYQHKQAFELFCQELIQIASSS